MSIYDQFIRLFDKDWDMIVDYGRVMCITSPDTAGVGFALKGVTKEYLTISGHTFQMLDNRLVMKGETKGTYIPPAEGFRFTVLNERGERLLVSGAP
tara:strand:+ start:326 stop:616 length:291 start_codon:yes stop_codon:yes gene_type:complete